jgi:hypothetical protein
VFIRADGSNKFYIPVKANEQLQNVHLIFLYESGEYKPLVENKDYLIKEDEDRVNHIEWLEHGLSPEVGESFNVTYDVFEVFDVVISKYQRLERI